MKNELTKKEKTDIEESVPYYKTTTLFSDDYNKEAEKYYKNFITKLRKAPAFISYVKSHIPKTDFVAVLSKSQKESIKSGALKLMKSKDGKLYAELVNPKNNRIAKKINLAEIKKTPALEQAQSMYMLSSQMAELAIQMQEIQTSIEAVRVGQENDRLAGAYSCQQKFLQAMKVENPQLKKDMLLKIAMDAEDARNKLMLSQKENIKTVKEIPESSIGKLMSNNSKNTQTVAEVRDGLYANNLLSVVEMMCYKELGEEEASRLSLKYYGRFLEETYFSEPNLIERLDSLDSSITGDSKQSHYWKNILPDMKENIKTLPDNSIKKLGGKKNGKKM